MSEASLAVLQCKRRCNSSVSKNAPSGWKTHPGGALVSFAGAHPIPGVVKAGNNCEDAACMCGIQPKATLRKCHALSIGCILCLKRCVSLVLPDVLKKGERELPSELVSVLLPR